MRKLLIAVEIVGIGVMAFTGVFYAFTQRNWVVGVLACVAVAVFLYRRFLHG